MSSPMSPFARITPTADLRLWAMAGFVIFAFLVGGAARPDVQSLVLLRPISVLACAAALFTLSWEDVRRHATLYACAAATFAWVAIQLIPLPPAVWHLLPGRAVIAEIDTVAGLSGQWRPISLVPWATWNAFYSLFTPLAVLLLGSQLKGRQSNALLPVIIGLGAVSGLLGLLQILGPASSPLYLYSVTNEGAAVGLFANRNHAAILLSSLFPMLAVYASMNVRTHEQKRFRAGVGIAVVIVLIPLLLVTGSRIGVLTGVIGLGSAFLLYRPPAITQAARRRGGSETAKRAAIGAFAVASLAILVVLFSRAQAIERLLAPDQVEDLRFRVWGPIAELGWKYFPFGSGMGSFVEVFRLDEPSAVLKPSYLNHAHNDWLETLLTGGLPALMILAAAIVAYVRRTIAVWNRDERASQSSALARTASVILLLLALGSASDYPLRTPALMCIAVIAALWLGENRKPGDSNRSKFDGSSRRSSLARDMNLEE